MHRAITLSTSLLGVAAFAACQCLARDADVIATSSTGQQSVVAKIRGDIIACRVFYGTDAWFEWNRAANSLRLMDHSTNVSAILDPANIAAWSRDWESRLNAQRDAAREVAQDKNITPEARAMIAKYADGARSFPRLPSRAAGVAPSGGAQTIAELVDFRSRLEPVMADLRTQMHHAELALAMLDCAVPVTSLPAEYTFPSSNEKGAVSLAAVSGGVQPSGIADTIGLSKMFARGMKASQK